MNVILRITRAVANRKKPMPDAGLPSEKLPAAALGTFTVTSNGPFPASGSATEMGARSPRSYRRPRWADRAAGLEITGALLAEPILTVTVACLLLVPSVAM